MVLEALGVGARRLLADADRQQERDHDLVAPLRGGGDGAVRLTGLASYQRSLIVTCFTGEKFTTG